MRTYIITEMELISIITTAIDATVDKVGVDRSINPWKKAKERLDVCLAAGEIAAIGEEDERLTKIWD